MTEYLQQQTKEAETMNFWTDFINKEPENFKTQYKKLGLLEQCKLIAFIQVRDSKLYKTMLNVLGEE